MPAAAGAGAGGPDVVEIGFTWYAERVQRIAVNTECKLLLCTHAFDHWKVRRVLEDRHLERLERGADR